MKILVIPDVHLKKWIFDKAEEILNDGKADRAVCLMDIPDDWNMQFQIELYRETYDRAIKFVKDFTETLWCYGNHDLSYPWGRLETGYSPYAENTVMSKLEELEHSLQDPSQIAIMQRIDNVLFSHGGLSEEYVKWFKRQLFKEKQINLEKDADIDDYISAINKTSQDNLWNDDSPLWLRSQYRNVRAFQSEKYKQVVGHTPVETIYERNGFISTDVFSTYSDGKQIGESAMIVIDSISGEYEKVFIAK
ncbi:MAG: metallophosphoesterase [Lachnospiraceae bacterium]|nr:metallophosphoesterase [Lachnospiraceae bacterium]